MLGKKTGVLFTIRTLSLSLSLSLSSWAIKIVQFFYSKLVIILFPFFINLI